MHEQCDMCVTRMHTHHLSSEDGFVNNFPVVADKHVASSEQKAVEDSSLEKKKEKDRASLKEVCFCETFVRNLEKNTKRRLPSRPSIDRMVRVPNVASWDQ